MSGAKILALGAGEGWHANELRKAAARHQCKIAFRDYESLYAKIICHDQVELGCGTFSPDAKRIDDFDAVLTRTMPTGSLEKITFRLAVLHSLGANAVPVVNAPSSLELAIDKFATLAHIARLGFAVPDTIVVQSRGEAVVAFKRLGGDCIVKPIFGGEGRGVMRIQDPQLAWYAFSTLEQIDAAFYIQAFVPPGGRDTRLLVIGDRIVAARRQNDTDFRTNFSQGARTIAIEPTNEQIDMAHHITSSLGLTIASVDMLDSADGPPRVLEVNGVPGWKGLQSVCDHDIASLIIETVLQTKEANQ
ncbi:Ribosomal protein S6 modification protein [Planctomycetes bacterium CA13]|uniref:Ribosomal protein S6 modification protein n=1 Tax=Novipirellula herctigrandis TaxID=2527986 RepID=A0A5C5YNE2_9BACT|nr:Ribosomal protein S6 modification protein [Planctomycetes bacterium CA13]